MGDLFFMIKTLIGTTIVVVLMQVKVGEGTVEDYTMDWIRHSPIVQPLEEAAHGGVIVIRDMWNRLTAGINTKFSNSVDSKNVPGQRSLGVSLERSKTYLKRQAQKATEKIKREIKEQAQRLEEAELETATLKTPKFKPTPPISEKNLEEEWVE